jgi:C1A family cysteine protease
LFSRLDLYAMTRELEGTPLAEDSGCEVRDVFKAMARWGVCYERTWPYKVERFDRQPSRAAMVEGVRHRALRYLRCADLRDVRASIATGHPVIGGFQCYESLENAEVGSTGLVPVPSEAETAIGGHCVMFVGYDDAARTVEFQNSWGTGWGRAGYGYLPYEYFERALADDFWTIRGETT